MKSTVVCNKSERMNFFKNSFDCELGNKITTGFVWMRF